MLYNIKVIKTFFFHQQLNEPLIPFLKRKNHPTSPSFFFKTRNQSLHLSRVELSFICQRLIGGLPFVSSLMTVCYIPGVP